MRKVQTDWFRKAVGRKMNPDKYAGFQCKDTADDYVQAIFPGKKWSETLRPADGKDVLKNASAHYFTKYVNDWTKPDQLPAPGDIINWGWSPAVPEGHVAVVEKVTKTGVHVIQQDGYAQVPAHRAFLPWTLGTGASVVGWLRPRADKMPADPKPTKGGPRLKSIPKGHPKRGEFWVKVNPGNTLGELATWQGTTLAKVLKLNPQIDNPAVITPGEIIRLK